ncbi:hypothetical protein LTR91_002466 [Friedmanniomyces endolithicus]|uniref:Uncharacterized protein n=1 Tax=Friedmanniomyces endolithicus TaxID=329885 RepID=A0AAN6KXZ9_9PEZI|nr:hypothetical protein LTR57_010566 [Friedmanniomyces endolithicus]KAK1008547.1 hypothetical protein LTS01_002305 [Friedmanniomyces endolithicus]KAK1010631.1 hypothetical protein LTR91_002466 [Friedmanniomyces endolithicus]
MASLSDGSPPDSTIATSATPTGAMPQIHWTTPTLLFGSLLVGTLFALGHHLFYASLDGKAAAAALEDHHLLGMDLSSQQINTAAGTAFAFLVRACLTWSISIAWFQILIWTVATRGVASTKLVHLDVMTSALHDLVSLVSLGAWLRRPWLWILALVAWLIPIASILTPATLSVGIDFPAPIYMNVPNVDFTSLNLAAPMAAGNDGSESISFHYLYAGPSLSVQQITNVVSAHGTIIPVAAPSVNSSWDLDFHGPSLDCAPVAADFRQMVLANVLDYTSSLNTGATPNRSYGPGYISWHPPSMVPDQPASSNLPFVLININSTSPADNLLNNAYTSGLSSSDMASVFLATTPTLFSSISNEDYYGPALCQGMPWYSATLAEYYSTSTVLRCDVHNATYHTTFNISNSEQTVSINERDLVDTALITIEQVSANFGSSNQTHPDLQPQPCSTESIGTLNASAYNSSLNCLFDAVVLSTISYQAIMHAFIELVTGMIALDLEPNFDTVITSTTQLSNTVLAEAPELAFLQPFQLKNGNTTMSLQERAPLWNQQPYAGLVNAAAAPNSTLPFQQALEQLFENITISLMSAPDLQPNSSSIYYPAKTKVTLATRENIYIYAAYKLWLAYGLAIAATALIAVCGLAAMLANGASFSNSFSTILRLSRGAQLDRKVQDADLSGRAPLPGYLEKATVRFSQEQVLGGDQKRGYTLVDMQAPKGV